MKEIIKTQWQSDDNEIFDTKNECIVHEAKMTFEEVIKTTYSDGRSYLFGADDLSEYFDEMKTEELKETLGYLEKLLKTR